MIIVSTLEWSWGLNSDGKCLAQLSGTLERLSKCKRWWKRGLDLARWAGCGVSCLPMPSSRWKQLKKGPSGYPACHPRPSLLWTSGLQWPWSTLTRTGKIRWGHTCVWWERRLLELEEPCDGGRRVSLGPRERSSGIMVKRDGLCFLEQSEQAWWNDVPLDREKIPICSQI